MTTCISCDCDFSPGLAGAIRLEDRCQECRDAIAYEDECALILAVGEYLDALDDLNLIKGAACLRRMREAYKRVSEAT